MRIGIIGTGDISHSFMKAIQELQDLKVRAVYQRNIEKAHHFAKTYQIDYASDDFEMFLDHVDLVYIALPNALHYEFALKSIKEGKHVIVEKPITINLRQYEELIKQAKQHKVKVFEMNRVLALPHMKQLESYMEKENGKTLVHLDFCKKSRRYEDYKQGLKPNVFTTEFAGGALYDLGVYALHFMVKLKGYPLNALYKANILASGVDGSGIILLEYENCLVSIHISKISQGRSGFLIEGEHYTIQSNTAVSVLDTVIYDDDQAITQMQSYSNMYYSLKEIFNCIQMDDASYYDEHIKQTTQVVKLLEYLRLQNEIIFE